MGGEANRGVTDAKLDSYKIYDPDPTDLIHPDLDYPAAIAALRQE